MKLLLLTLTLLITHVSFGQCSYEYNEKDMITSEPSFKTKKFKLSKKLKKKPVYSCAPVEGQYERGSNGDFLVISLRVKESYGKNVTYMQGNDSLILKFADGEIRALPIGRPIGLTSSALGLFFTFSYTLDEAAKTSLKNKAVVGFRISGTSFNIDVEAPETELGAKFRECWVN